MLSARTVLSPTARLSNARLNSTLVVAEHDEANLAPITLNAITAFRIPSDFTLYSTIRKQNPIVTISTFIGWYFSLIIAFVLPLDVAITFFRKCENDRQRVLNTTSTPAPIVPECEIPGGYVPDDVLFDLWRVVYWSAQILTWFILPLLQSYVTAVNFTMFGKIRATVINNTVYYAIYSLCFLAILIYAMFKGVSNNIKNLKVILVSASNTWGLFLLVVLLGHGLVELPRSLWHHGNRHYRLRKTYFDIEKLASEKCEAEENVKEIYKKAGVLFNSMKNDHNGQRRKVRTILSKSSRRSCSVPRKHYVLRIQRLQFGSCEKHMCSDGVRRFWYTRL
ncbi:hypothetical protein B9Z55_004722 [Caenorhabditis nigoni]|uniref:Uncharacterized protein n=1 Tax=Caenorhabditis nigoni TaxID=1611254 RepID=A0A2G5UXQ8_9PELO|nr:hypothetical protein B9Z55_004722 [Caenorhabditis nigoni]